MNEIIINKKSLTKCIIGSEVHALYFKHDSMLNELPQKDSFHVLEVDGTIRAIQSSKELASKYMKENRILVYFE